MNSARCRKNASLHRTPDYNGFDIPESSPLITHLKKACAAAGLKAAMQASGGGSDTNILNERGIPSLNLSIGMTNVHTTRESIKKADIIKAARLVLALIATA